MEQKQRFGRLAASGRFTFTELGADFRVSRKTGHKWWRCYQREGSRGLHERSRRPHGCTHQTAAEAGNPCGALRNRALAGTAPVGYLGGTMAMDVPVGSPVLARAKKPCALGMVLSGGGVRGVAHIGVLRALLGHGVAPDCVAGVSAGAIVGALYAAGHGPAEMLRFFQTVSPLSFANFTLSKPGFMDTNKLIAPLAEFFPQDSFESLQRKLLVVATDLLGGQPVIFDSGELIRPVLASAAVPMVYSPTEINGRWYCDGGVADNFPADLLADRCERIIGVHVSPLRDLKIAELGNALSVLERAMDIGMFLQARAKFSLCDILIQPDGVVSFGMFDKKHVKEVEEAGYEAAMARMPEILALVGEGEKRRK